MKERVARSYNKNLKAVHILHLFLWVLGLIRNQGHSNMSASKDKHGYDCMSYRELQQSCKNADLLTSGNTETLRKRLYAWREFDDSLKRHQEWRKDNEASNKRHKKDPAADLVCPITLEFPWEPVMAEDGRVYDRPAIEKHFSQHNGDDLRSPVTNEKMGKRLLPAVQHKNTIEAFVESEVVAGDLATKWEEKKKEQRQMAALIKEAESGDAAAMYKVGLYFNLGKHCLLYTSPSPRDQRGSRMPSSA